MYLGVNGKNVLKGKEWLGIFALTAVRRALCAILFPRCASAPTWRVGLQDREQLATELHLLERNSIISPFASTVFNMWQT